MPRRLVFFALFCAALAAPLAARGAYAPVRTFSRADGLPGIRIHTLFQDADGTIWAGTERGAARYDGRAWRTFTVQDGLAGPEVFSITQDAEGNFWFGTSGGICRFTGQFWDRLGYLEGLAPGKRLVTLRDREGNVWFGASGLFLLDLARHELDRVPEVPPGEISSLFLNRQGELWLTADTGAARFDGRLWKAFSPRDGLPDAPLRSGIEDSRGNVWLATRRGLVEYNGRSFTLTVQGSSGLPSDDVTCLAQDRAGRIWAGTASGPAVYDGFRWQVPEGLDRWPDRRITSLLADRSGNLWAGTESGIVFMNLSWDPVTSESPGAGPRHPFLLTSRGVLWYATERGAESRSGRSVDRWGEREGLEGFPRTFLEDQEGDVWIGTDRGLFHQSGQRFRDYRPPESIHRAVQVREGYWVDQATREYDTQNGLMGGTVNALLQDERGWIWAATDEGLSALNGNRWVLFTEVPGLSMPVRALAGKRTIWAGTDRGLMFHDGATWREAFRAEGPREARVTSLLMEGDDHLWVGTETGLWELRGERWKRWGQEDGLLADQVLSLARDPAGLLWVGTRAGLALFDGTNWSALSTRDGLPAPEILSVAPDAAGNILVAGPGHVTVHHPDRTPPQTAIRNAPTAPVGSPQHLFEFIGADLIAEPFELRFSWRLDGGEWSPYSREPLVTLSDLANGSHRFEVRALDRGLNADPTPAVALFEVNTALFDVEVRELVLNELFASLYRYYASDFPADASPVGRLTLFNKYDRPLKVKVSLSIPRFMDFPTDRIVSLKPGEEVVLPLRLELSDALLQLRENAVEQLMVTLQYYLQGEMKENKFSRGLSIHGRNAMTWNDPRKICLYISHLDPEVEALARGAVAAGKGLEEAFALDNNFIRAVELFEFLGRTGVRYLADPQHPYTGLSSATQVLDFVRYPRETLAVKSGDCDDIAVLYAAFLQSVGIDTALVDVGDHVFVLVDTGLKGRRYRWITPDRGRVWFDDAERIWIPVETTLLGQPFAQAWDRGLAEMARSPKTIIVVKDAWKTYQPVLGGSETAIPGPPPDPRQVLGDAVRDLYVAEDALLEAPVSDLRVRAALDPGDLDALNRMGIILGTKGYLQLAERSFTEITRRRPDFAGGWVNLANILYERGDYARAVEQYRRALELDPGNSQVHVEIALTYSEMGNFEQARRHYLDAVRLNPELGAQFPR